MQERPKTPGSVYSPQRGFRSSPGYSTPVLLPSMIVGQTLGSTLGAALFGGFADAILYGIATSQCFTFIQSQPQRKDPVILRISVTLLWLLATVHTALILQPLYWYMIQNFGDTSELISIAWGFRGSVVVTAVSDAIVRSWFIYRIWKLSERNRWLTWPLAFLNLSLFGVTLTMAVWSCLLHTLEEFTKISYLFYTTFSIVVVVDVSIAISLLVLFTRMRHRDVFHKNADVLTKLIGYTMNTGLVTSIVSGSALILYALMPENYIFLAIGFPLSGLYINSLLASFNARQFLSPQRESFYPTSFTVQHVTPSTISAPISHNQTATISYVVSDGRVSTQSRPKAHTVGPLVC